MQKIKIGNLEISRICLGGGKLVDMPIEKGKELVNSAIDLGITIVDGHHRYGNAEEIYSHFPNIIRMTKVSAYKDNWRELVDNSKRVLGRIDIMWVSDLDDVTLYERGVKIYKELKNEFPLLGVTTENCSLAYRFKREFPDCKLFMIPVFLYMREEMVLFIKTIQTDCTRIFAIKTFLDGQLLKSFSIKTCLEFVKNVNPDIVVIGTSNNVHLREVVDTWKTLDLL